MLTTHITSRHCLLPLIGTLLISCNPAKLNSPAVLPQLHKNAREKVKSYSLPWLNKPINKQDSLANPMEHDRPSEVLTVSSASREIPCVLWNMEVNYRVHVSPVTCPYRHPGQSSPCPPFKFLEDPFQYYPVIHVLIFKVVSFLQVSPPKPFIHFSSTHTCYMHHSSHPTLFNHPNVWGGI